MDNDNYKKQIASLLPEHSGTDRNFDDISSREELLQDAIVEKESKVNAATLAKMKLREKQELKRIEKKKSDPTYGMTQAQIEKYDKQQKRVRENIAEIEAITESPEAQNFLAGGQSDMTPYSGTTRRDVVQLLTSLNINLSLNLSRSDTYNLLGCLLTCNEAQLNALMLNTKVPVAIKTVIKRLLEDSRLGNMDTIEKLWDRIFGKTSEKAIFSMPNEASVTSGIIPNTVVSREAYMIIRDTVIGKD